MYKLQFLLDVYKETAIDEEVILEPTGEKLAFEVYTIDPADVENKDEFYRLIAKKMAGAFTNALRERWRQSDGSD